MHTPASLKGHPIHPMLVVFPVGLWGFSLIADLIHYWRLGGSTWSAVAYYTMAGGIVGALAAAVPGLVDLISIRDRKAKRIGIAHMVINLFVVGLYVLNLFLRRGDYSAPLGIALSAAAVGLLCVSGWLGGELVYVYGIAVEGRHEGPPHVDERHAAGHR
jgi:uncharacterized membrane protein